MKTTNRFQWMAALLAGIAMTCVTMTSCSKEDNPVVDTPDIPGGFWPDQVKEISDLTTTAEIGWVIAADSKAYPTAAAATAAGTDPLAMVASIKGSKGLAIQLTLSEDINYDKANEYVESLPKVEGADWILPSLADWQDMFAGCAVEGDAKEFTNGKMKPIDGFRDKFAARGITWVNRWFWTRDTVGDRAVIVGTNIFEFSTQAQTNTEPKSYPYWTRGCLKFEVTQK